MTIPEIESELADRIIDIIKDRELTIKITKEEVLKDIVKIIENLRRFEIETKQQFFTPEENEFINEYLTMKGVAKKDEILGPIDRVIITKDDKEADITI